MTVNELRPAIEPRPAGGFARVGGSQGNRGRPFASTASTGGGRQVARSSDPVLWQLSNSIFSEKARFALDYKTVPHRRKNLPPGLHSVVLRLRGRGSTVPVLDIEGRKVRDSSAIIATLEELVPDPPLYPGEEPA